MEELQAEDSSGTARVNSDWWQQGESAVSRWELVHRFSIEHAVLERGMA